MRGGARALGIIAVCCGIYLLAMPGAPPLARTQEARVLETAREMLDAPAKQWLIPRLNGQVRLQKPPLAYWIAAGAYIAAGSVSTAIGRIPFMVTAILTLILTIWLARQLFGNGAAAWSAIVLGGSFLFYRHGRLAETDILVTLMITGAIIAFWRAIGMPRDHVERPNLWLHIGALCCGGAVLAKGLPAVFPLLFVLGMAIHRRDSRPLGRLVWSGALLSAIALAGPWFVYIWAVGDSGVLTREISIAAAGQGHHGSVWQYLGDLLVSTAPWTWAALIGLWAAIRHVRRDSRLGGLLIWLAAVLVPLFLAGQKQRHYLLPAMPALACIAGWWIDRGLRAGPRAFSRKAIGAILSAAAIAAIPAGAALVVWAARRPWPGGDPRRTMSIIAAALLAILTVARLTRLSLAGQLRIFAAISAILLAMGNTLWMPASNPFNAADAASRITQSTEGNRIAFLGTPHIPLIFEMRRIIPLFEDAGELHDPAVANRPLSLIAVTDNDRPPLPPDAKWRAVLTLCGADETFTVFEK